MTTQKYKSPARIPLKKRDWIEGELTHAPAWCSVDLRDGNQALPMPMNPAKKLEYFKLLADIGFKEIEVAFPSASQDDFEFTRELIEHNHIPGDVRISVLTQMRESLIRRTVESLKGVHSAVLHAYIATSDLHGQIVFGKSREEIKRMAVASIRDSTMMYFSCDVGKFLDSGRGLLDVDNFDYESLMGTTFGMDKRRRVESFASGSSHAMTLVAVDLDADGRPKKWMVENSWGPSSGYKGHLIMTDRWFDEYMFRLVVERKYVPQRVLDVLKQKPVRLPAWDPMFADEE